MKTKTLKRKRHPKMEGVALINGINQVLREIFDFNAKDYHGLFSVEDLLKKSCCKDLLGHPDYEIILATLVAQGFLHFDKGKNLYSRKMFSSEEKLKFQIGIIDGIV